MLREMTSFYLKDIGSGVQWTSAKLKLTSTSGKVFAFRREGVCGQFVSYSRRNDTTPVERNRGSIYKGRGFAA